MEEHDERPWGNFTTYIKNNNCTVKIIEVKPNQKLSRQYHEKRDELWVMLDEGMTIEINEKESRPKKGEEIKIQKGTIHRLSSEKGGRVLEISTGEFDENDIVRLDDIYGRIQK